MSTFAVHSNNKGPAIMKNHIDHPIDVKYEPKTIEYVRSLLKTHTDFTQIKDMGLLRNVHYYYSWLFRNIPRYLHASPSRVGNLIKTHDIKFTFNIRNHDYVDTNVDVHICQQKDGYISVIFSFKDSDPHSRGKTIRIPVPLSWVYHDEVSHAFISKMTEM